MPDIKSVTTISSKQSGGSERGAAKIVGCKPIKIRRRKEMWERGEKLKHPVNA